MISEPDDIKYVLDQFDQNVSGNLDTAMYPSYVKIEWISKSPVFYEHTKHIMNPWNKNQVVNYSKEI